MPLIYSENTVEGGRLAIWKSAETVEELQALLNRNIQFAEIKSERRIKELLSARIILKKIFELDDDVIYEETGKPRLSNNSLRISVAHSGEYVAVLTNKEKEPGVDIEAMSNRILKISKKFVSENERHLLRHDKLVSNYKIWGAKEVAYKIYGKKGVDFKRDLFCHSLTENSIKIIHHNNGYQKEYSLNIRLLERENLMIVYGFD